MVNINNPPPPPEPGSDRNTTRRWLEIGGQAREGMPLFLSEETQQIGPNGLEENAVSTAHRCQGCRSLLREPTQAGAVCSGCDALLCVQCGTTRRCALKLCGRSVCPACSVSLSNTLVYCRPHFLTEIAGILAAILLVVSVVVAATALLW